MGFLDDASSYGIRFLTFIPSVHRINFSLSFAAKFLVTFVGMFDRINQRCRQSVAISHRMKPSHVADWVKLNNGEKLLYVWK